ncbi:sporulation YhaL family protein [Salinibacillus xinjiangensis]|uniref:SigE-dependent sporulation protein n=1 Tax=Salinibacillus xinjiangensis TaxID=1229268 RepID=A0A6G1X7N2_9BACI|nr:sporulation YhaL family protein [Salinibacillus xinjiangensis]MRG86916.1 SigE-dependent sporulation protein [Salinibacillus xinjiangensis]
MFATIPWWVAVMIGFIIFSGYMAFRAMRAEMKLEREYIEKEGQVYMERIEEARRRKEDGQSEEKNEVQSVG